MAKRKRKAARRIPVIWVTAGGQTIEFVERAPSELAPELARVADHGVRAAKVLSRLKRLRNVHIVRARFELGHCQQEVPDLASHEWLAGEIARLSYVYKQVLDELNKLCHARTRWLEEARFLLTYGQTPQKREPAGNYGSRSKQRSEE